MTLKEFFKNDRYAALSGVELLEVSEGYALARMEIKECHLNAGNSVQGGAIFTLGDLAFAAAVNACGRAAVSLQTSIYYHKGISAGTLFAEAKAIRVGKTTGTFDVPIRDQDGELIATFVATAYRMDTQLPVEG